MAGQSARGADTTATIVASATNDSAATGDLGEYVSSEILAGSAVSVTSNTDTNITSISLTAGDWDVWGSIRPTPAGTTTMSSIAGWVSSASATLPTQPNAGGEVVLNISFGAGLGQLVPVGTRRFSLSGTTTVYLSCRVVFAVSTLTAFGFIGARRVR